MARVFNMIFAVILVIFFTSANGDLATEIDVFKAVGLGDKAFTGVKKTTGENDKSAAYHFDISTSDLKASQEAFTQADKLIHNSHDFIVSAWFKLDSKFSSNSHAIVSISSLKGKNVYFKLIVQGDSNGKGKNIIASIQGSDQNNREFKVETIRIRNLYFTQWHKVAVRVQDTRHLIRIFVDDQLKFVNIYNFNIYPYPQGAQLRLAQVYVAGDENVPGIEYRTKFQGALQDVKFLLGTTDCPALPKCKCSDFVGTKECVMDGLRYEDGSRWTKDKCTICQCKEGQVICAYTCKVCKDNGDGKIYMHGETWKLSNDTCQTCKCEEGTTTCSPPTCPKPDCSGKSGEKITLKGQCCPICKEDQCLGTDKPVYKTCGCDVTCSNKEDYYNQGSSCGKSCYEGCFCKRGEVMNEKKQCMADVRCGCTHKGKKYKVGEAYESSCEYCLCLGGRMICYNFC